MSDTSTTSTPAATTATPAPAAATTTPAPAAAAPAAAPAAAEAPAVDPASTVPLVAADLRKINITDGEGHDVATMELRADLVIPPGCNLAS